MVPRSAAAKSVVRGAIQGDVVKEIVLSFGKHRGKPIKEVDDGYLQWVQATHECSWWRKVASQVLEQRKQAGAASRKTEIRLLLDELKSCRNLRKGKEIHVEAIECGHDSCVYVATALAHMYAQCGSMEDARHVFEGIKHPSVVSWTVLISGYAQNGDGFTALDWFARMKTQGCTPNSFTLSAALKACTCIALQQDEDRREECLVRAKAIHSEINCRLDMYLQSTLIETYAKCGSMYHARQVFDGIEHPDVVSWTALILGYAENGEGATALEMFEAMKSQRRIAPNSFTFIAALKACSLLGALESGSKIHAEISSGNELNTFLVNGLVDFYAKCGSIVRAQNVFDSHPRRRNLVTWNALLAGYSRLGASEAVFQLFRGLQDAGFQPNSITFLCILTCCSHAGLVEKASHFFELMSTSYGVAPAVEHYTCMVDILGRSNKLDDAVALLRSMPCRPNSVTWMAVLGACHKWKNVEVGRLAFKSLLSLGHATGAAYVLMAHIYGSRGMWEEQELVLAMRENLQSLGEL